MSNRRPFTLLVAFAVTAVVGFVLAVALDEQKGWNHLGQAVANIGWIAMLVSILGFAVTGVALTARSIRHRDHAV